MIFKQITFTIPLSAWLEMRSEAARLDISIAELCRRLMDAGRPYVNVPDERDAEVEVLA